MGQFDVMHNDNETIKLELDSKKEKAINYAINYAAENHVDMIPEADNYRNLINKCGTINELGNLLNELFSLNINDL